MLFIATQNTLREIPRNLNTPDFYIEKISGDFLPVKRHFKNSHVYFVGTSRGCSCDFGIKSNQRDLSLIAETPPIQKFMNKLRQLKGTLEKWEKRHEEKIIKYGEEQQSYLLQTRKLIDVILGEIQNGSSVEMYCVWAGGYNDEPEIYRTANAAKENIREDFEIDEKEFTTFA